VLNSCFPGHGGRQISRRMGPWSSSRDRLNLGKKKKGEERVRRHSGKGGKGGGLLARKVGADLEIVVLINRYAHEGGRVRIGGGGSCEKGSKISRERVRWCNWSSGLKTVPEPGEMGIHQLVDIIGIEDGVGGSSTGENPLLEQKRKGQKQRTKEGNSNKNFSQSPGGYWVLKKNWGRTIREGKIERFHCWVWGHDFRLKDWGTLRPTSRKNSLATISRYSIVEERGRGEKNSQKKKGSKPNKTRNEKICGKN